MQIYDSRLKKSSYCTRFRVSKKFADFGQVSVDESGFALPSVLFLLVILTTLAFSLLSVSYLEKKIALKEQFQLQAEYAAQSGIALTLDKYSNGQAPTSLQTDRFEFPDGSFVETKVYPWGAILVAESVGSSHRVTAIRHCLVAEKPSSELDPALVLANPNHSLVMTGTAMIKGDVVVGSAGVSTGSLRDHITPMKIPVHGKIKKLKNPELPLHNHSLLDSQRALFNDLLDGNIPRSIQRVATATGGTIDLSSVSDSLQLLLIEGDAVISGIKAHCGPPLYILSNGSIRLKESSHLSGLIALCSTQEIVSLPGSRFENVILYSQDSIAVLSSEPSSGQLISPAVTVQPNARLKYPSFILSVSSDSKTRQEILLAGQSALEGTIALLTPSGNRPEDQIMTLEKDSKVSGTIYCQGRLTLDGSVSGSVLTTDFYFYEAPTHYLGWIRKGFIERSTLPDSFMGPPGISRTPLLGVLQWI